MEVIVKSSPKIEIELATKVVKVSDVGSKVTVDSALSTTSENPVMNKVITEELGKKATNEALSSLGESVVSLEVKKADKDGVYSGMTVGTADDLAGRGESVPASFGFRASGGKSIKDGRAYIKRIKGNSVVWNQKVEKTYIDGDRVLENIDVIPQNHKFALIRSKALGGCYYMPSVDVYNYVLTDGEYAKIFVQSHVGDAEYSRIYSTGESGYIQLIDLTQMFQASNEPTTIEEFNARVATLGVDMNAYNEGEVIHCNTESIKSVGDNAWDGTLEKGRLTNGIDEVNNNMVRSDDYIKILPSQEYYALAANNIGKVNFYPSFYDADKNYISGLNATKNFSTPTNAMYMRFFLYDEGGVMPTDYNGLMISLVHSGWKQDTDAGYQPYWQDTLPLPIIRKYFPQGMKLAGSAHDEIRFNKASGKWEAVQRIGSVRVADYVRRDAEGVFILSNLPKKPANNINGIYSTNVLMVGYTPDLGAFSYDVISAARIAVVDDTIWLNAENLKQYASTQEYIDAIGDTKVFYELAEPIVTELDAEDQNFRDYYQVADFGTEQSQSAVPSAAFSADIIYQFNAVDMIREHELEITELQNVIATMQAQLASLTNS